VQDGALLSSVHDNDQTVEQDSCNKTMPQDVNSDGLLPDEEAGSTRAALAPAQAEDVPPLLPSDTLLLQEIIAAETGKQPVNR
jgi:hypothetical protein